MPCSTAIVATKCTTYVLGRWVVSHTVVRSRWCWAAISAGLLDVAVPGSLLAQPTSVMVQPSSAGQPDQVVSHSTVAQAFTPAVQQQPGSRSKVEETAKKKGKPSAYGTVTKPGFFALVEHSSAWIFPRTGAA